MRNSKLSGLHYDCLCLHQLIITNTLAEKQGQVSSSAVWSQGYCASVPRSVCYSYSMSSMSTIPGRRVKTDKTLKLHSLQSTDCRNKVCAEKQVKFGGCIRFMNLLFCMPFAMKLLYDGKLIKIGSIYK